MSSRRSSTCLCGARVIWVPYAPVSLDLDVPIPPGRLTRLPFDARPVWSPQLQWRTANYAIRAGRDLARIATPARPLDPAVESPYNIHFATCPVDVTADELYAWARRG